MATTPIVIGVLAVAAFVALLLALVIFATDPRRKANRRLGLVLFLEAAFLAGLLVLQAAFGGGDTAPPPHWLALWDR